MTRDFEVEEDETLTDFQEELIQAAAALTGEHVKDIYPFKLVENMKASHGAKYVEDAFNKFLRESKKAKDDGADEHEIVSLLTQPTRTTFPKTFLQKVFSCLVCDN